MTLFIKRKTIIITALLCLIIIAAYLFTPPAREFSADYGSLDETVRVPIIMYHSIMEDTSRSGAYVITPDQLEDDFRYLKDNGYSFISFTELYEYTQNEEIRLPAKTVMITFDDGYYNNYAYGFPLMKRYNVKCLISPIGERSHIEESGEKQVIAYSHLNWEQIKEMYESGLVEIGNHTYNMHKLEARYGIKIKYGESKAEYRSTVSEDINSLQRLLIEKTGISPTVFAYPFGYYSETSEELLSQLGFKITLTSEEGVNIIHKNSSLRLLKRYNRPAGISSDEFFSSILN